jgi:hypothetical protein
MNTFDSLFEERLAKLVNRFYAKGGGDALNGPLFNHDAPPDRAHRGA